MSESALETIVFDGTPGGAIAVFEKFDIPDAKFLPNLWDLSRGVLVLPDSKIVKAGGTIARTAEGTFELV